MYSTGICVRFQLHLNFLGTFSINAQISNLMTIRPVGAELLHADRQTDRHDETNIRFRNFVNAPKNSYNKTN